MTDDDYASEREEQHREWAMKNRRPAGPAPCGRCHYCHATVGQGAQFCSTECREDYDMAERAKTQNRGR